MANERINVVGTNIAEKATMIWNVADMLRGAFKPHEYGLVILPIGLDSESGIYKPATSKSVTKPEEKKPLDEVIEKINELYNGTFTDADRVVVDIMRSRLMADAKLIAMAKSSDPQIFRESIFPRVFGTTAQDCYIESQQTFTSMFEDQAKYNAIMHALGALVYREMRATV